MRIDAHQHFWRLARGDYGWLTPALGPIYRDFMPDDLTPELASAKIDKTILVQAAPSEAETHFLLEIAAKTPFVAGVVGWVDFDAPDAATHIATMTQNPRLVGLRPMIHDIADPDWMLSAHLAPVFEALIAHDLTFDALVKPPHLTRLLVLAERYPGMRIVIDHGAKPLIARQSFDPWRADMAAFAGRPNVTCKLSGLVTEAAPDWRDADLSPVFSHLIAVFGPERLIFGSDWPVLNLAGDYARWVSVAERAVAPLGTAAKAAIFGGNAQRIYLERRGQHAERN